MRIFEYNRGKSETINVLKAKAEKKHLNALISKDRVEISLQRENFSEGDVAIPVNFKGKLTEENGKTTLKGKFTFGFYLYTLVIVAILLIAARLSWSVYQHQMDNIILCGIVSVVLLLVILYVNHKAKSAKGIILDFLNNINKK